MVSPSKTIRSVKWFAYYSNPKNGRLMTNACSLYTFGLPACYLSFHPVSLDFTEDINKLLGWHQDKTKLDIGVHYDTTLDETI